MFQHYNTIGKRLFIAFGILALNVIIICILSYRYNSRNRQITEITQHLESQRIRIARLLKLDLDFLRFETINQTFYATGKSPILEKRDSLLEFVKEENKLLRKISERFEFEITPHLDSIDRSLLNYNQVFNQINYKITVRGFKDFGLEGKMRQYAHELENQQADVRLVDVLMLRRHEKDFFMRKEERYKEQFNQLANKIIEELVKKHGVNDFVVYLMNAYQNHFNKLAALEAEIGMVPTQGLLGSLNEQTNVISDQLERLVQLSDTQAASIIRKTLLITILIGVFTVIGSFAFTYYTAIRLTRPIKKLSNLMSRYVINQGFSENELSDATVTDEIQNLSGSFIMLTRKLKAQFDETQRKSNQLEYRNKELQKLNEELDRFIYSSAHDLKSPLASLDGLVNLARIEISTEEHNHYFDKMKKSIERMSGFIRDITDYAKNKRQRIHVEKIDLEIMIDDIFQSLDFLPEAQRIERKIAISVDDFYTDRTRLEIILKNLLSNALRYSDLAKDYPSIFVIGEFKNDRLKITVEDNGIGIAQHHLPRIFDMFYRAVDNAKGSGIGLFLVRESVKMLRGHIRVHSVEGKGTTFNLFLPNLKRVDVNHLPESEPMAKMASVY